MKYKSVREAVFIARPNRFIAKVDIEGQIQTVHVKNTGRCRELLREGAKVYLEDHGDQRLHRKTRYSLISVEKNDERIVNIDSYAPNRVVGEALESGRIELPSFGNKLSKIKPETTFGFSRFDFYIESCQGQKAFIEVKGVTLEEGGTVRFPDAPT